MKFPEICRCRNEEKNIKKYIQQAAHNSESKLYLKDLPFVKLLQTENERKKKFRKKKSHKNQLICSLSLFGSVHSLSGVLSSILFLISRRSRLHSSLRF